MNDYTRTTPPRGDLVWSVQDDPETFGGNQDTFSVADLDRVVEAARAARIRPVILPCLCCGKAGPYYLCAPFGWIDETRGGVLVRKALCVDCILHGRLRGLWHRLVLKPLRKCLRPLRGRAT